MTTIKINTNKLQIVSDLHIERFYPIIPDPRHLFDIASEVIILNGDVGQTIYFDQYSGFLSRVTQLYKHVILILGNHELYSNGETIVEIAKKIRNLQNSLTNLIVLTNEYIFVDTVGLNKVEDMVMIFGSTYFSQISDDKYYHLACYNHYTKAPVTCADWNALHYSARTLFERAYFEARRCGVPMTVVTHYSPTFDFGTLSKKFLESKDPKVINKNCYYCSNNTFYIRLEGIKNWVYGHTGNNTDVSITTESVNNPGVCRLVSNQLAAEGFDRNKVIQI